MTQKMKAVRFHGPGNIKTEAVDPPGLARDSEVRVRIKAAGICGSDLHVYETGAYVTTKPVTMGHEYAGIVLETGRHVTAFAPGDHVVGDSRLGCGHCRFCENRQTNLCANIGFLGEVREGAFAEEIVVDQSMLIKISPDVPFEQAALAEPLAVALHAVSRIQIPENCRIMVLGAGPIGALIHAVLKIRGMDNIFITDLSEYRRNAVLARYKDSVVEADGQYDLVFETTGSSRVLTNVIPKILPPKGALVMVGLFEASVPFNFNQIVEKEWLVRGCAAFSTELPEATRLLEDHWQDFRHIISHLMTLDEAQAAFDLLLSPEKKAVKIIFMP